MPDGHRPAPGPPTGARVAMHVLDVDLAGDVADLPATDAHGAQADRARVLIRRHGVPVGIETVAVPPDGLPGAVLRAQLEAATASARPDDVRDRAAAVAALGPCSVVVCTRERPVELERLLESLVLQDHPDVHVWVVDNAPRSSATREVVDRMAGRLRLHYLLAPVPGLSRARNVALAADLVGEVVAWIDDDEIADPAWLGELHLALHERPDAAAVTGLVVPAELATPAQVWFEQFGGHSKGRGVTPTEFSARTAHRQHPLYPLPPFGVGANMAFRTAALRAIGGFDEALGAGTRTKGAEDTLVFSQLLWDGATTLYRPSAVTRHYHRRDEAALRAQMEGYGRGLTAFYTALVLHRPSVVRPLAGLAVRAVRDLTSTSSARVATLEADFPRDLLRANRRGMLAGPWSYLRQRASDARRRRSRTRGARG